MNQFFNGPFAEMCERFVAQKRAAGFKYQPQSFRLRQFDNFCKDYEIHDFTITDELMSAYCIRRPNESDESRRDRIYIVRSFADFLVKQGYTAYVIPEMPRHSEPHKPYIFTKDEIKRIFNRLDSLEATNFTNAHIIMPMLFRLLYGCGLRIGEALSLIKSDVNLETGVIHIRTGKYERERITPMSESLISSFKTFMTVAHSDSTNETPLFYSKNLRAYSLSAVHWRFRNTLWDVGIPYLGKNAGPRVHDFRHTFMCHNIQRWAEQGIPIHSKLKILSKYVGHSSVSATQWYLRLTAETFPHIREICECELGGIYFGILKPNNYKEVFSDE